MEQNNQAQSPARTIDTRNPPVNEAFRKREQVQNLYMQAPISNVMIYIVAALFSYIIASRIDSNLTVIWCAALFLSASFRLVLWLRWRKLGDQRSSDYWLRVYLLGCLVVGVSWSLIFPLIYLSNDAIVTTTLSLLIFGIVGASVIALSVYLPAFMAYTYPQLITLVGTLLMFQEHTYNVLSAGIVLYVVMITLFTRNINRHSMRAIDLNAQNLELIDELNREVDQREVLIERRTRQLNEKNVELETEIAERKKTEEALKDSHERFRLAMKGANDGLFDWDLSDNTIYYSPRWKNMLGYAEDELANDFSVWEELVDSSDREKSWDMLTDYINGARDNFHLEFKMKHKDGHWVDVLSRAFLLRDERGDAVRVVGTHLDISEIKYKDEQINVLSHALEQSPVSVVITDTDAKIEYVNKTFEEITGYSAEEVMGENPRILKSGLTPIAQYQDLWNTLTAGKAWSSEIQNRKKSGELYWESVQIAPVTDHAGSVTHFIGVKEDITAKKLQEEKILYQAHYDNLTALPNRFLALDRLKQAIKESHRSNTVITVQFLDLDGFKRINDSLGHEVGDKLLVETAKRLSTEIRDEDTLCRLGGDEFVIIQRGASQAADASIVAENLLSCFRKPFVLDERELTISASIGIAIFPDNGRDYSELLRNADTAMYHAKEMGRNTYQYYTESMSLDVSRRMSVEQELFSALADNELSVLYQPIFNLRDNEIRGVEALLRWHSKKLGDVSPEEFIPIAEQSGAINEIGMFVLEDALSWNAKWNAMLPYDLVTSVNISPSQFRSDYLPVKISALIEKYQVKSKNLELEITEGVLLSGYQYIDEILEKLISSGIVISMDDFGTGYSSLSYLRRYPFSTVKIDRSFIRDVTVDPADRELIYAAISMGHGLGLQVVAEGVENDAQQKVLDKMQCDFVQGFLYSKAVDPETISQMLERQ